MFDRVLANDTKSEVSLAAVSGAAVRLLYALYYAFFELSPARWSNEAMRFVKREADYDVCKYGIVLLLAPLPPLPE